ncbi:MAG: ferritin-like domain-containing protein [Oligoflexales bacterium]
MLTHPDFHSPDCLSQDTQDQDFLQSKWCLENIFSQAKTHSKHLTEVERMKWFPLLASLAFAESTSIVGLSYRISTATELRLKTFLQSHLSDERKHALGFERLFTYLYPSKVNDKLLKVSQRQIIRYFANMRRIQSLSEWLVATYVVEVFGKVCMEEALSGVSGEPITHSFLHNVLSDEARHTSYLSRIISEHNEDLSPREMAQFNYHLERMLDLCSSMFLADDTPLAKCLDEMQVNTFAFCQTAEAEILSSVH